MLTTLKLIAVSLVALSFSVSAKGVYQKPADFINEVFINNPPKPQVLWLNKEDKKQVAEILSHPYKRIRIRYWRDAQTSAWVLEEIGKEKPITIGVHIRDEKISQLKVLAFRESRGDEIRHKFYTKQFIDAKLNDKLQLDKYIDGITGATMSVRASTKIARLALWLDKKTTPQEE